MKSLFLYKDIGIDLGTSNTLMYVKDRGIILREPSVVAIDNYNGNIIAVGADAKKMLGRSPQDISVIRPLKFGVIADFDTTRKMLKYFLDKVTGGGIIVNSKVIICHPAGITEVEKRAIGEAVSAFKVMTIEEPVAAALGANMPVNQPVGIMVVDIGGGTTEIAVICYGRIVNNTTIKVAGDILDEAIVSYLRKEFKLLIGTITAEEVKIAIGSVYKTEGDEDGTIEVIGRDLTTGLPKVITINSEVIREALKEPMSTIINAIRLTLERTEPELAKDIKNRGIMLSGGGSMLKGLAQYITTELNVPSFVVDSPLDCVVLGAGKCIEVKIKPQLQQYLKLLPLPHF